MRVLTHVTAVVAYILEEGRVYKKKKTVLRVKSISSSLKCPARKQLRENMPYPNDMRFPTRIVTQTN